MTGSRPTSGCGVLRADRAGPSRHPASARTRRAPGPPRRSDRRGAFSRSPGATCRSPSARARRGRVERGQQLVGHLRYGASPIDGPERALAAVVADHVAQRAELLRKTRANSFDPVVLPLDEPRAVDVAPAGDTRRIGGLVVDVPGRLTDPAARHPPDDLFG